ncbi:prepilin peptidase [Candidatus Pacearchaeota archaeon]|nr:prepilin peptidase [Candidatus Pacearchaeota archaeon]
MNEYFFMYSLAFVAILFAVIQDIRTREIANWTTFSLLAFVIAYRAFYSIYTDDVLFFVFGIGGILLFMILGYSLYYSKVFAGGDAKLLFGLGGIFQYSSLIDYVYYGFGFLFVLFSLGVVYTLIYSLFLAGRNYSSFKKSFFVNFSKVKYYFVASLIVSFLAYFWLFNLTNSFTYLFFALFVAILPLLFAYVKAVESSCMIKLVSPKDLTEGDWLEKNVYVGKHTILKNFQGLSFEEILLLRRSGKKVWIKNGVPFAPAFLLALIFFMSIVPP